MDREYLEDYQAKEEEEYRRLVVKKIEEGNFDFERDRYPPDRRFVKLQRPTADTTIVGCDARDRWAQVPFSGSTIILLPALASSAFEECFFKISEIPKVIDFIKETGKMQITLQQPPKGYEGLDYLDPIFKELRPPYIVGLPIEAIGTKKQVEKARDCFFTLAKTGFAEFFAYFQQKLHVRSFYSQMQNFSSWSYVYAFLKLGCYSIAEEVEDAMIDSPPKALLLLSACSNFIIDPFNNLRFDSLTHSFEEVRINQAMFPRSLQPEVMSFPCEIGKFLLKKLTYAPQGIRACNYIIDHYNSYDLQKVQKSLNEAILTNQPDIVTRSTKELTEILDNTWKDKTIPNRIKNIKIGVPVSIAALGGIVAGLPGLFAGGFLSELGFKVTEKATEKYAEKLFSVKGEDLTERLAKLKTKSYQANIYDFKKKYKHRIVQE